MLPAVSVLSEKTQKASSMADDFQKNFRIIVEKIFNNWQNLRLAVEHGMGGRNGQQVAIEIMDYVYKYCIGNGNITNGELQDVLEELMDQEFNTLCDDSSIEEICRNLLRYKHMSLEGKNADIEIELSRLPQGKEWLRPDVKIVYTSIAEDSSDEETDGAGTEEMDTDDDEDEPTCSRVTRSQTRKKQDAEFVEPEPGWSTVRRK